MITSLPAGGTLFRSQVAAVFQLPVVTLDLHVLFLLSERRMPPFASLFAPIDAVPFPVEPAVALIAHAAPTLLLSGEPATPASNNSVNAPGEVVVHPEIALLSETMASIRIAAFALTVVLDVAVMVVLVVTL